MAIIYKYPITEETTITELLNDPLSLFAKYKDDKGAFLAIKNEVGFTNADAIKLKYDNNMAEENPDFELIPAGTVLYIEEGQSNIETASVKGKYLFMSQDTNYKGFWARKLIKLHEDAGYIKEDVIQNITGDILALYRNYNMSVWCYSKALDKIIDITPFVENLNTTVAPDGGSFNFTLSPVLSYQGLSKTSMGYVNFFSIDSDTKGKFNIDFNYRKLQQNDIVFLRFEKLKLEQDRDIKKITENGDFEINKNQLPNKVYDMIGLIDDVGEYYNAGSNEVSINVSGRDLIKLLQEDGSYFFPVSMLENTDITFVNTNSNDRWFKRTFVTGAFKSMFIYSRRSIEDTIGFIINQLSNLGVVSNDLFKSYENSIDTDEKLRGSHISITGENQDYVNWVENNGIWQIIKVLVDDSLADRRIANSQISKPDGSLLDQMNNLCQKPFVEFFGDTYGANYNFIARQPPFTKEAIKEWMKIALTIDKSDVLSSNLSWETEYYTWFQLNPQDSFLGKAQSVALAYLPVVWFQQFADKFGNHRLVITDNYQSHLAFQGEQQEKNTNKFKEAVINDFKLIIDSYIYLPFTRRGTITINGDRRIKRGTWIKYAPTNELFYVESVANNFSISENSIDRTTTLTVKRGLVMDFIEGHRELNGIYPSYFNIANTELIKKTLINKYAANKNSTSNVTTNVSSSFVVDDDIFNFFLQRRQFDTNSITTSEAFIGGDYSSIV